MLSKLKRKIDELVKFDRDNSTVHRELKRLAVEILGLTAKSIREDGIASSGT